jgi:hypothetical protein
MLLEVPLTLEIFRGSICDSGESWTNGRAHNTAVYSSAKGAWGGVVVKALRY